MLKNLTNKKVRIISNMFNIRYRGPIESDKMINFINQFNNDISLLQKKTCELLNKVECYKNETNNNCNNTVTVKRGEEVIFDNIEFKNYIELNNSISNELGGENE